MNVFSEERAEALTLHPTVKPVRLVADAILDVTRRGDIVLDGFIGSGTAILAAEQVGRVAYGVEIEPRYVDVAIRRWQTLTGESAHLDASGATFDAVATERTEAPTEEAG
jgi:DNA modification methylase